MRRSVLVALGLAALVATAGCAGTTSNPASAAPQDASTATRTITVSATGEAARDPNLAVVRVSVLASAENASTARQRVAADANAVRHALRDAGVADEDIQTVRYGIEPRYGRDDRANPTGYRAIHTYEVTVQNPENAGTIIDAAVAAGADRVDDVRFTLTDAARATVRKQAFKHAVQNARSDAEAIAAAANVQVERVVRVDATQSADFPRPRVAFTADAAAGGGATELDTGPVTVRVHVTVTYRIG